MTLNCFLNPFQAFINRMNRNAVINFDIAMANIIHRLNSFRSKIYILAIDITTVFVRLHLRIRTDEISDHNS